MNPERQREIAKAGGKAAHAKGTAHQWDSTEAAAAGRKGGLNSGAAKRAARAAQTAPVAETVNQ